MKNKLKIALVTCADFPQLIPADQELIGLFAEKNATAEAVVWNDKNIDWRSFDVVVMRSMWDYYLHPQDFAKWLDDLAQKNVRTLNSSHILEANKHKFYLRDLQAKGVKIIPTIFLEKNDNLDLSSLEKSDWKTAILKPAISAGSYKTVAFECANWQNIENDYRELAKTSDLLLQSFVPEIQTEGEISLIFFNRKFSHSVVKLPKTGDFRVQSQFGGQYSRFFPDENLLETAAKIIACYDGELLYARVDGVMQNGSFLLMEVEQIEPDLYFYLHEPAKQQFVDCVLDLI